MLFIELETLSLYIFDKANKDDLEFIKKLVHNEEIKKWVHGIANIMNKNEEKMLLGHGFIIKDKEEYIGYIGIGNFMIDEKCVYLRAGIDKDKTGMGYGKKILSEITEYIFANFEEIESIKLVINSNNKPSLKTAGACGYTWLKDDCYVKYNPYIKKK